MVIIHDIKSEGEYLKIDCEIKGETDSVKLAQVIHGIITLFVGRVSRPFVNNYLKQHFKGLEDSRKELVLHIQKARDTKN